MAVAQKFSTKTPVHQALGQINTRLEQIHSERVRIGGLYMRTGNRIVVIKHSF